MRRWTDGRADGRRLRRACEPRRIGGCPWAARAEGASSSYSYVPSERGPSGWLAAGAMPGGCPWACQLRSGGRASRALFLGPSFTQSCCGRGGGADVEEGITGHGGSDDVRNRRLLERDTAGAAEVESSGGRHAR